MKLKGFNELMDQAFSVDADYPYLGQTAEPVEVPIVQKDKSNGNTNRSI